MDPGFGSSNFAIVCTQLVDGKIQVIAAEEYDRPDFTEMINEVWNLKQKCGQVTNIYADAANPEVWQALKKEFNEPFNEQYIKDKIAYAKKYNLHIEDQMFCTSPIFDRRCKDVTAYKVVVGGNRRRRFRFGSNA